MRKIKVSHEVPFCLLEDSLKFNDMQYALPHLLESNEQYRNHFLKCKEDGVEIYLDNSLHELGYAMDDEILIKWMNILQPSTFFIPDAWEDKDTSEKNAERWRYIEVPEGVTKCAIVQAKNEQEAMECFMSYIYMGYKKIAFSYGASYYNDVCPLNNKDIGKAVGRFKVVDRLCRGLSEDRKIHLLGTAWPAEFSMYKNIPNIESIDTSNPIMAGIDSMEYNQNGISFKPKANMNNFQDVSKDEIDTDLIDHNVKMFRKINNL